MSSANYFGSRRSTGSIEEVDGNEKDGSNGNDSRRSQDGRLFPSLPLPLFIPLLRPLLQRFLYSFLPEDQFSSIFNWKLVN